MDPTGTRQIGCVVIGDAVDVALAEGDGSAGNTGAAVADPTGFQQGGAGAGGSDGWCVVAAVDGDGERLIGTGTGAVGDPHDVGEDQLLAAGEVVKGFCAGAKAPGEAAAGLGVGDDGGWADAEHGQQCRITQSADAAGVAGARDRKLGGGDGVAEVNVADAEGAVCAEGAVGFAEAA